MKQLNQHASVPGTDVKSRMVMVRGEATLLDRDVAALYGVQTKEVNQAVRNNPAKFPAGFCVQLDAEEFENWKSKILTSNLSEEEKSSVKISHEFTRGKENHGKKE